MKILRISVSLVLCIASFNFTYAQEIEEPIIIHPIIGEKLDRAEEEFFKLFQAIEGFQEARFYLEPDSTLQPHIVYESSGIIKDTILQKHYTVEALRKHIDQILAIEINTTQNIEITTGDSVYKGTIYSYRNNNLTLIQDCCSDDNLSINNDLISQINTSEIQTIKTKEANFFTTFLTTSIGLIGFSAIGSTLDSEKTVQETRHRTVYTVLGNTYSEEYIATRFEKDRLLIYVFAVAGAILGYFIGQAIKSSVEYDYGDPDAEEVILENSLLPSGISSTN